MKVFDSFFFALLITFNANAQKSTTTHLLLLAPPSTAMKQWIDRAINDMNDPNSVRKVMKPFVNTHPNTSGQIWVALKDGSHKILYFGRQQLSVPADREKRMLSKGAPAADILTSDDFKDLPDSLLLLDTLNLNIRFTNHSFPSEKYFLEQVMNSQVVLHGLPLAGKQIAIIPQWFIGNNDYTQIRLRNSGTPSLVLWECRIRSVSAEDMAGIQKFALKILETEARDTALAEEIADFCAFYYGPVYPKQIPALIEHLRAWK